jgi:integrase
MPFFTRIRACDITTDRMRRYIDARLAECAQVATVNRELALLKRAFNLARECTPPKVKAVPYIPMLKESNVRKGFVRSDGYGRLAEECGRVGLWMRALLECGYSYGWRHEELLNLRTRQVDLLAGTIRLDPGMTKNGYQIVAPSDLRDAARKLETSQRQEPEALEKSGASEFGQSSGRGAPELEHTRERPSVTSLPN